MLSQGTALLRVSSQQDVIATLAAAFNEIEFLNQAQPLCRLHNIVQQIEAPHKLLNKLLKMYTLKTIGSHIFPKEKCVQTYSYIKHLYPES